MARQPRNVTPSSTNTLDTNNVILGAVPGKEIRLNEKQHAKLLEHIKRRMEHGAKIRDNVVERYEEIDRQVLGYIKLDQDDMKRERDNKKGEGPKPVNVNIQLTEAQLDEAVTYILSVIAPEEGIYGATARKNMQDAAKAFVLLMNKQSVQFSHYRHLAKGCVDAMKFNFGGWITIWERVFGNIVETNQVDGSATINENQIIYQGNSINAIDPYNFCWDPSVNPLDLAIQGEFFYTIEVTTSFKLKRMEMNKEIFGTNRFMSKEMNKNPGFTYYKVKPEVRSFHDNKVRHLDFVSLLSSGEYKDVGEGWELINFYCWLVPSFFNLSKSKKFEIWRFTLLSDKYILAAEHMDYAHGQLPISITMPVEDGLELQSKSYAEKLLPFQTFASHEMNVHQRRARKALYRHVFYDKVAIPDYDERTHEGGAVPVSITGQDKDVRKSVFVVDDQPMTRDTMQNVEMCIQLMQQILPTNLMQQVAGLERATQYQAAATVQGANRRNLKIAKIMHDQAFAGMKNQQMTNIYQFQESMSMVNPDTGEEIEVNPAQFREAQLEFTISDGLKGIDKLIITESLREVVNYLIQSQTASQVIDIVQVIDYWLSMVGDRTDFKQFAFKNDFDKLTLEQKQAAFELLRQAAVGASPQNPANQLPPAGGGPVV